ncbi:leucine-zipper-like transcriptional regulator 1 [Anaeramoeba flamelloides]|uniref:Leucine-zipper-like transcriptional regulator 1 n=1 Tax=Anaeramoeba flamelloides TaxID=1746091 RepID=A0ABQ8XIG6_9EUKA|nr:leucine-zipper-like transcriptional regulator 1 [Anaeramoeba flamelloides]
MHPWRKIQTPEIPLITSMGSCVFKEQLFIQGGLVSKQRSLVSSSQLLSYNPSSNEWRTYKIQDLPEKGGHSMAEHEDKLYILGGVRGSTVGFYEIDLSEEKARVIDSTFDGSNLIFFSFGLIGHELLLWGGLEHNLSRISDKFMSYNLIDEKWENIIPSSNNNPELRSHHGTCFDDTGFWIYGGLNNRNNKIQDFWRFEYSTRKWIKINQNQEEGKRPGKRFFSTLSYGKNGNLYLFGGHDGYKFYNDLWEFNVGEEKWNLIAEIPIQTQEDIPLPRRSHTTVCINGEIVVFGGKIGNILTNTGCIRRVFDSSLFQREKKFKNENFSKDFLRLAEEQIGCDLFIPIKGNQKIGIHTPLLINRIFPQFASMDKNNAIQYLKQLYDGLKINKKTDRVIDLLNDKQNYDVILIINNGQKKLYLHKCVLIARSNLFRNIFSWNNQKKIEMKDPIGLSEDSWDILLDFIYSGNLPLQINSIIKKELEKSIGIFQFFSDTLQQFILEN